MLSFLYKLQVIRSVTQLYHVDNQQSYCFQVVTQIPRQVG